MQNCGHWLFLAITTNTGLSVPTQNLRASRETELLAKYPQHVVTAWIGHTPAVGAKHYWSVTEDHFAEAAGGKSGGMPAGNPAVTGTDVHGHSRTFMRPISLNIRGIHEKRGESDDFEGKSQYTPQEYHHARKRQRIRRFFRKPAGFPAGIDTDLARVIAAWPHLNPATRAEIVRRVGG